MEYRTLGKTGYRVSSVSLGCWAIGDCWGPVDDAQSWGALKRALKLGVNFFDTADVYGSGKSERLLGRLRREADRPIRIATKVGRGKAPHTTDNYTEDNLRSFVALSLENLQVDCLDLLQLHCPPTKIYYQPEVFDTLDALKREGKVAQYGVSVEKVEEAIKAIEYPGVASVQIVYNLFRQRPAELFFRLAREKQVGIIARLPLVSGLLTGKMRSGQTFATDDHRHFNREGQAFDKGETFAGVPFEAGLEATNELKKLVPSGQTLAEFALKWILMNDAVSCVIPGAKHASQVDENMKAADLGPLSPELLVAAREIYDRRIAPIVHQRW